MTGLSRNARCPSSTGNKYALLLGQTRLGCSSRRLVEDRPDQQPHLLAPAVRPGAAPAPSRRQVVRSISRSTTSSASSVSRIRRCTLDTSSPSAWAISAADATRPSWSSRCQWCASPSARNNAVSLASVRAGPAHVEVNLHTFRCAGQARSPRAGCRAAPAARARRFPVSRRPPASAVSG